MRLPILLVASSLVILGGCGRKKPPDSGVATPEPGGFVDLDLDEDEEDLDDLLGSELMQATAQCGDLVKLEPKAMMGKLSDGEIRCLDASVRESDRQTVKDKVSRVLMADAWAKGDKHRWEGVVRRHLSDIDQSDPDLCYKFAKHMVNQSADKADETIRWANVALENKSAWVGDTHVKRVYNLYKIKAVAAQKKWEYHEAKYLEGRTEEGDKARTKARNDLKTQAREWLEYARSAGKDPTLAHQLCVSAAGTDEFCD